MHDITFKLELVGIVAEFAYPMEVNEKSDVHSFGVLSLEMMMGRHPGDFISSLSSLATQNLLLKDVVDQRLPYPMKQVAEGVMSIARIAFSCLSENPQSRPSMKVCKEFLASKSPLPDQFDIRTIKLAHLQQNDS